MRVVVVVVSVVPQLDRKTATKARRVREISLVFIHQGNAWENSTGRVYFDAAVPFFWEQPTKARGAHVSKLMKIHYLALGLLAAGSLLFSGCATDKTETTQTQTDPTKRVHTQEELKKSGQSETGPALEKTEPSMTTSGPR